MSTFAERLNHALEVRHRSAAELAKAINVEDSTISNYRKGRCAPKRARTLEIARFLNVSIDWLFGADVPFAPYHAYYVSESAFSKSEIKTATGLIKVFDGIPCGDPQFIDDSVIDYQPTFLPNPNDYFAVIAHGDSMIDAGIAEGDRVILQIQNTAENGDIVACRINSDESTLKRFFLKGDNVVLMPANTAYDPIIVPASAFDNGEAQIMGVAIEVSRRLR